MYGQLTAAKAIADNPTTYAYDQLQAAYHYLVSIRSNGGVCNSARASHRLERRLAALQAEIDNHLLSVSHCRKEQRATR